MLSIGSLLISWLALVGRVAGQTLQVPIEFGGLVDVRAGNPAQQFKLILDTGSASTWLKDGYMSSLHTGNAATFNAGDSGTFRLDGRRWIGQYGFGMIVKGELASDELALAGGRPVRQVFGLARSSLGLTLDNFEFDGALGLGDRAKPALDVLDLVQNLYRERLIEQEVFSMHLLREEEAPNGTLTVGGVDSQLYTGAITYVPIESRWVFFMDRVYSTGLTHDRLVSAWQPAVLDSTSNVIMMPVADATAFWELSLAELDRETRLHKFDSCNDAIWESDLVLEIDGRNFTIPGRHLVIKLSARHGDLFSEECFSAVLSTEGRWVLGQPFLRNVYTVYDYANKQVGFAEPTNDATRL